MQPLFITAAMLGVVAFLFSNYIIPIAELKSRTLLYDIRVAKPAFDIKEGIFYNKLDGYSIKIGKKENDTLIRNVIIYEQSYTLQDQMILADEGTMTISSDQRFLIFNLKNGWRYQEKGQAGTTQTEFYRLGFKEYKKVFDLSSFKLNKTADSAFKSYYKMLSLQQLTTVVDSLSRLSGKNVKKAATDLVTYEPFLLPDSIWKQKTDAISRFTKVEQLVPDSLSRSVYSTVNSKTSTLKSRVEIFASENKELQNQLRLHKLERHRKFTLSFACIVLFLIGAPLGSIIRKGGLGLPLVISVVFFIAFHITNTSGEKMVKQSILTPFSGMWLSTMILVPVGLFLTYKAMQDSQLFNIEFYRRMFQKKKPSHKES
jgi:lipopolysaccharide export system permease protein